MDDQPAAATNAPDHPDLAMAPEPKPEPKPGRSPIELELLGMAIDANELISRIHAGQGDDLTSIIRRAIGERPACDGCSAACPISDLQDAA